MRDLHEIPKLRDSLSYLYVEHAVIERRDSAVELIRKEGRTHVPATTLCLLMLGPGTSITHAAMKVLGESGCSVLWTGEDGIRLYAQGCGETRKAYHLLRQATLVCDPDQRQQVVLRMYQLRFGQTLDPGLSLPQIRGMEGARIRKVYAEASQAYGVAWAGRRYDRSKWDFSDPVNRALSAANALLNGICHAAIVSGGYSPALGFIHTGRQLSFVYDIADLYKTEITIPIAFRTIAESPALIDSRVRLACREKFRETRLLERILPDIGNLLGIQPMRDSPDMDMDSALSTPEALWEELWLETPAGLMGGE